MKKTILLVEDNKELMEMIKGALQREFNVLEASTCSESQRHLSNHIDLALIDYLLPDGDGFEVLDALRRSKPALPAIMMTGYSQKDLVIRALRAGVTDYIEKPVCLKYLREKLSAILDGDGANRADEHLRVVENREESIMVSIASFIRENYMQELSLEKMLKLAGMNRTRFCATFKQRTGRTFVSYLNQVRIENASELLKNSDLNVTGTAHKVGYKNVIHFERVFRKMKGTSPRRYRNGLRSRD